MKDSYINKELYDLLELNNQYFQLSFYKLENLLNEVVAYRMTFLSEKAAY